MLPMTLNYGTQKAHKVVNFSLILVHIYSSVIQNNVRTMIIQKGREGLTVGRGTKGY